MSNLIYSPFANRRVRRDFGRLLDDTLSPAAKTATNAWAPNVDIHEDEKGFRVLADLPGVDSKDVDITLEDSVLTIKGSRSTESETEEAGFKRRERFSGEFVRRFTLPDTVDSEAITAKADNGVLRITIPKREQVLPRSIAIEA